MQTAPTIVIAGQTLPAAICEQCGTRLYPLSILDTHMERHEIIASGVMPKLHWAHNRPGKIHFRGRGRPRKRESEKKWPAINILHSMSGRRG